MDAGTSAVGVVSEVVEEPREVGGCKVQYYPARWLDTSESLYILCLIIHHEDNNCIFHCQKVVFIPLSI